jgi:hypothetical protein
LAAPNVTNAGDIEADEQGQILLIASQDKVYLQPGGSQGLLVEVETGGKVSNLGNLLTRQGNITLAGFAVNQGGRVKATTSTNINGTIRLQAREKLDLDQDEVLVATATTRNRDIGDGLGTKSTVTFGTGSVTEITADSEGGAAIDDQLQPSSNFETFAHNVHLQSGSSIVIPGGNVFISATDNPFDAGQGKNGRVLVDKGAKIDVSGLKQIPASIERNVIEVPVQSFELRDSPLQKDGVLKGQTVRVDRRVETEIVDTSGAEARFERSLEERLGKGGNIAFDTSGDVIVNTGAVIDISGGTIEYESGYINTTKLLTDYGTVVDIGDADPDEHYQAIVDDALFGKGRFEEGYTEGLAAGKFSVTAPALSWNGELVAGTVRNTYQRDAGTVAFGGAFSFNSASFTDRPENSAQNIRFMAQADGVDIGIDEPFPKTGEARPKGLVLSSKLTNSSGIQELTISTLGMVVVDGGTQIAMPSASKINLEAGIVNVWGDIYSAGGNLAITSEVNGITDNAGHTTIGPKSTIDVSGRWVNDFPKRFDTIPTEYIAIDGGEVDLTSEGDLKTAAGSVIRANGGAWFATDGSLTEGKGGTLSFAHANDGLLHLMQLDGRISAAALLEGGSLSIKPNNGIVIGTPDPAELSVQPLVLGVEEGGLKLTNNAGLSHIDLGSQTGNFIIKADAKLDFLQENRVLRGDFSQQGSRPSIMGLSDLSTLPDDLRNPVDLLLAGGALAGFEMQTGSQIIADKEAAVGLSAGGLYVDGLISAPGGAVNLTISNSGEAGFSPGQAIRLGENANIKALGVTRLNPTDARNLRTGEVLAGGNITLDAKRGYVVLETGSQLDVSGGLDVLDLPVKDAEGTGFRFESTEVGSPGGSIHLKAAEGLVLDGSLKGFAGSQTNQGGRIDLELNRRERGANPEFPFPSNDFVFNVTQEAKASNLSANQVLPDSSNGQASVGADKLMAGGFGEVRLKAENDPDSLALGFVNEVRFLGDVNLAAPVSLDIDASKLSWSGLDGAESGKVRLSAPHIRLGSSSVRVAVEGVEPALGGGKLTAKANWTELSGASIWDGFNTITLSSKHDLRLVGNNFAAAFRDYVGSMVTAANVNLNASQIYPATLTQFNLAVKGGNEGTIKLTQSGNDSVSPLSAGGVLNFSAPVIDHDGTLRAPFGSINLLAETRLDLGPNSLTSVSGAGQTIPFGSVQGGLEWLYPLNGFNNLVFSVPPEKKLTLSAPIVSLADGSSVDLSGGGDLISNEFLPGIGGSFDYLAENSPAYQGGFAVLPALDSGLAPFDPLQSNGFNYRPGSQIHLSGFDGLSAGDYTILPARYALLPGAYLVTPQANTQDLLVANFNSAGLAIVPGYLKVAGTEFRDSRTSGFLLESGADVRRRSEYDVQTANSFYPKRAAQSESSIPFLPKDSGQITVAAEKSLALQGNISVGAPEGRGARMDISAARIRVVDTLSLTPQADTLEILADDLTGLGVYSLFLGGARTSDPVTGATNLSVIADTISVEEEAKVSVSDFLVAAKDKVEVKNGAVLTAEGNVNTEDTTLNVSGDGALLRLSADNQVALNRTGLTGNSGELVLHEGANLTATKSMLLDASKATTLAGDITMEEGSLNLSANAINIGEVDNLRADALNLSNEKLASLTVDELVLSSRDNIGLYGRVGKIDANGSFAGPLTFSNLVVDAAGFIGIGASGQTAGFKADTLLVQHTLPALASTGVKLAKPSAQSGNLAIEAGTYTQGMGDFAVSGFKNSNITAGQDFIIGGDANLKIDANLNLTATRLTATDGSDLNIDATGQDLRVMGNESTSSSAIPGLGGSFSLVADNLEINTQVLLPSGALNLTALQGDVSVGGQADINLAGSAVSFADTQDYTSGGLFKAVAEKGNVVLAEGSRVNVSSGGGSAEGGRLVVDASEQSVELSGQILAQGGSAELGLSVFSEKSSFDGLMNKLGAAGVTEAILVHSRTDDINQAQGQSIKGKAITLIADQGSITLAGKVDADNSKEGGAIQLYAGDGITLADGATLTAQGKQGGKVLLSSVDSDKDGDSGIAINAGAVVKVGGETAETGGNVVLRALRLDQNGDGQDDGINIKKVLGSITGYAQSPATFAEDGTLLTQGYSDYFAEGVKKYTNADFTVLGEINATDIDKIKQDTLAYMDSGIMENSGLSLDAGIRIQPGVQIEYTGDLAINEKWDLADWRYREAGQANSRAVPGRLAINADGALRFGASLSDGFVNGTIGGNLRPDILQTGDSWSYSLTAGADLKSAALGKAVNDSDLTIAAGATVRTGTGDLQLIAGRDIILSDQSSTIYSAGRAEEVARYGTLDLVTIAFLFPVDFPVDGGDLELKAGNHLKGAVSRQFINDWLPRRGNWTESTSHEGEEPTAWGISASNFQQGIGSFGGGKVNVLASGNIENLSVMMPATGKQVGQDDGNPSTTNFFTNEVEVRGGGTMNVNAGGDIVGGAYLLAKGEGAISAGGRITGNPDTLVNGLKFINGPQLAMGDSQLSINAKDGISLAAVSDVMMMHSGSTNFFSYTETSGLSLRSLSGDVLLGSDVTQIGSVIGANPGTNQAKLLQIYPGTLQATAFGGSVLLNGTLTLFPSPSSDLSVLAKDSIASLTRDPQTLSMSDADRALLPDFELPLGKNALDLAEERLNPLGGINANVPVHIDDTKAVRLVTNEGDIKSIIVRTPKQTIIQAGRDISNALIDIQNINNDDVSIISAGRDISYTSERDTNGRLISNINQISISGPGDVLVKSGRNIDFGASGGLSTVGNLFNTSLASTGANITVLAGLNSSVPDYVAFVDVAKYAENYTLYKDVVTGFMEELGGETKVSDAKISLEQAKEALRLVEDRLSGGEGVAQTDLEAARGELKLAEVRLASAEAEAVDAFKQLSAEQTIPVQAELEALLSDKYSDKGTGSYPKIQNLIVGFMREFQNDPSLGDSEALAAFAKLKTDDYLPIQSQLNSLVSEVFFNELKETGSGSAASANAGNERGFAAISALFPGAAWDGDLSLFFSKVQTIQGGDINLMVPGGEINAGLAVSFAGAKPASELGIVAQGQGDINAFVRDDFIVNQSRVFALNQGDILVWSSEADIDAGRGAKSALSAPPPETSIDRNGNLVITFPPTVAGSGIRTAAPIGATPGDVFLFAPKGVVDAGEAGIGGTNVTISATAVLGAGNIQIGPGGTGTGVPVAAGGGITGVAGAGNVTASVNQMAQDMASLGNDTEEGNTSSAANKNNQLGVLSVEVIGHGEGANNDDDERKKNKLKPTT